MPNPMVEMVMPSSEDLAHQGEDLLRLGAGPVVGHAVRAQDQAVDLGRFVVFAGQAVGQFQTLVDVGATRC